MMRPAATILVIAALTLCVSRTVTATEDDQVAALAAANELAGAWSNDGFKLRDGNGSVAKGDLKAGESRLVQVNLFAGNDYWFTAATNSAGKVSVTLYDEHGKPQAVEPHQDGSRAAAGFSPVASGPYWVKISLEGGKAGPFALVYSYK
jgi:hypothetical protein